MNEELPLKRSLILSTFLCLGLFSECISADELSNAPALATYLGLEASYNRITDQDNTFNPLSSKLRAGVFLSTNIALELQLGNKLRADDNNDGSKTELSDQQGLFLRFQSPIEQDARVYLYGGYNSMNVNQSSALNGSKSESSLESAAWGIGMESTIEQLNHLVFYVDYGRLYDKEIRVSQYSFGARYQF